MNRRLRIAVADDELDMRDYFTRILPRWGHEVVFVAENGAQLVDYCRQTPPDLVVTDIRMPEMDGIQAATAINAIQPTPVILVSAFHHELEANDADDEQLLAYLVKPIKQADLRSAIVSAIRRFDHFVAARGGSLPSSRLPVGRVDAQRAACDSARNDKDAP